MINIIRFLFSNDHRNKLLYLYYLQSHLFNSD